MTTLFPRNILGRYSPLEICYCILIIWIIYTVVNLLKYLHSDILFSVLLRANEKANVKGPIFPKNIIKIIIAFPIIVKWGVKFILRPTVPNAENTSKALINRGTRSVILKIKIAKKINEMEIIVMVNDLTMRVSLMDF